jgi:hypothetical protein
MRMRKSHGMQPLQLPSFAVSRGRQGKNFKGRSRGAGDSAQRTRFSGWGVRDSNNLVQLNSRAASLVDLFESADMPPTAQGIAAANDLATQAPSNPRRVGSLPATDLSAINAKLKAAGLTPLEIPPIASSGRRSPLDLDEETMRQLGHRAADIVAVT